MKFNKLISIKYFSNKNNINIIRIGKGNEK